MYVDAYDLEECAIMFLERQVQRRENPTRGTVPHRTPLRRAYPYYINTNKFYGGRRFIRCLEVRKTREMTDESTESVGVIQKQLLKGTALST